MEGKAIVIFFLFTMFEKEQGCHSGWNGVNREDNGGR